MFEASDPSSPGHYGSAGTALLLLDFHTMFVQSSGGTNAPNAANVASVLRSWAKSKGIPVLHCLLDLDAKPFETCKGRARLEDTCAAAKSSGGDEFDALVRDIDELDVTFKRIPGYVSALKSPGLEDFLRQRGIRSLVLTGLSTSGCVLRTAVAASDAEYVVSVVSDGCADRDEEVHRLVTEKLLQNRGYVMTAEEFQKGFETVSELQQH